MSQKFERVMGMGELDQTSAPHPSTAVCCMGGLPSTGRMLVVHGNRIMRADRSFNLCRTLRDRLLQFGCATVLLMTGIIGISSPVQSQDAAWEFQTEIRYSSRSDDWDVGVIITLTVTGDRTDYESVEILTPENQRVNSFTNTRTPPLVYTYWQSIQHNHRIPPPDIAISKRRYKAKFHFGGGSSVTSGLSPEWQLRALSPTAPPNLALTLPTASNRSASLSWGELTTDEERGYFDITGYEVEYKIANGRWTDVTPAATGTGRTHDDLTNWQQPGTRLCYRVRVLTDYAPVLSDSERNWSEVCQNRTAANAPGTISDLQADTTLMQATPNFPANQLSWSAAAGTVLAYYIERRSAANSTAPFTALPDNLTQPSGTISLAAGETFDYRVRAYNDIGVSDASNTVRVAAVAPAPDRPNPDDATAWLYGNSGMFTISHNPTVAPNIRNSLNLHMEYLDVTSITPLRYGGEHRGYGFRAGAGLLARWVSADHLSACRDVQFCAVRPEGEDYHFYPTDNRASEWLAVRRGTDTTTGFSAEQTLDLYLPTSVPNNSTFEFGFVEVPTSGAPSAWLNHFNPAPVVAGANRATHATLRVRGAVTRTTVEQPITLTNLSDDRVKLAWNIDSGNYLGFVLERKRTDEDDSAYAQLCCSLVPSMRDFIDAVPTPPDTNPPGGNIFYTWRLGTYYADGYIAWSAHNPTLQVRPMRELPTPDNTVQFADSDQNQAFTFGTGVTVDQVLPVASGGDAPLTYSMRDVSAVGLQFDETNHKLTGTATAGFVRSTLNVTDADGDTAALGFTVTVGAKLGAPKNLIATGGGQRIEVTWLPPAGVDPYSVVGYRIETSPDGTANSWRMLVENSGSSELRYSHVGLGKGVTVHYRIAAIGETGFGSYSSPASGTTDTAAAIPSAPVAPTATPRVGYIDLQWQPPTDNGGTDAITYRVEYEWIGVDGFWRTLVDNLEATNYQHAGLGPNWRLVYRVYASTAGGESPPSNLTSAISLPGTPSALTATPSARRITLEWMPPAGNSESQLRYRVQRSPDGMDNTWATLVPSTDRGVTTYADRSSDMVPDPNKTDQEQAVYHYRVAVISGSIVGEYSESVSAMVSKAVAAPDPPVLQVYDESKTSIILYWNTPRTNGLPIFGYRIDRRDSGTNNWVVHTPHKLGNWDRHGNLPPGTTISYRIYATTSTPGQISAPSNVATATTAAANSPGRPNWYISTAQDEAERLMHPSVSTNCNGQGNCNQLNLRFLLPEELTTDTNSGYTYILQMGIGDSNRTLGPWTEVTRFTSPTAVADPGYYLKTVLIPDGLSTLQRPIYFRLRAQNSMGVLSTPSNPITTARVAEDDLLSIAGGRMRPPTFAPRELTARAVAQSIYLTWLPPEAGDHPPITGYSIDFRTDSSSFEILAGDTGTTDTAYRHQNRAPGTTYHYRVSAVNSHDSGPESTPIMVTTPTATTPGPPLQLTAELSSGRVTLQWFPPDDQGSSAISRYVLHIDAGRGWQSGPEIDPTPEPNPVTNQISFPYNNTNAVPTIPYWGASLRFRVRAINDTGAGLWSDSSTIVHIPARVPQAPTGLELFPGQNNILAVWTPPDLSAGLTIAGYLIESRSADGGNQWRTRVANSGTMQPWYRHGDLGANSTVDYRVAAIVGTTAGTLSAEKSATTSTERPTPPQNVTAVVGANGVTVRWEVPASAGGASATITGYRVDSSTNDGHTWTVGTANQPTAPSTEYTDSGGRTGHMYRVFAINDTTANNLSIPAGFVRAQAATVVANALPTPIGLVVESDFFQNTLQWLSAPTQITPTVTGYVVETTTRGDGTGWSKLADVDGIGTNTYTHNELGNGATVFYRIAMLTADVGVKSDYSIAVSGTTTDPGIILDMNSDGEFDVNDVQIMYYANTFPELVGDGTSATGFQNFRQQLLVPTTPTSNPVDSLLQGYITSVRLLAVPYANTPIDVDNNGRVDTTDALIMYYAYEFPDELGYGRDGSINVGLANVRSTFLARLIGDATAGDDALIELLRRTNLLNPP